MSRTIEDAIELAVRRHRGQKDKQGEPYILHPLRVMLTFTDDYLRMVAVLHDIIEDTEVTVSELLDREYPPAVVWAVEALTRRDGETYMQFIARAARDPMAKQVKLADIMDNLKRATPEMDHLKQRYEKAIEVILRT